MKTVGMGLVICAWVVGAAPCCEARSVSVEGIGISIRATDKSYRYKDDHLDTTSFDGGLIFPKNPVPAPVTNAMEYATHDFRPADEDPRTEDRIDRIKADAAGDLLIAMPSADASNHGWVRVTSESKPDFCLNHAARTGKLTRDTNSPYWFYKHSYDTPGDWLSLPTHSVDTRHPPFVFAMKGELYWENPPALDQANAVTIAVKRPLPVSTLANPNLIVMSNGDYLASITGARTHNGGTGLWRSADKGNTWTLIHDGFEVNRYSLFEHQGSIYLLGMNTSGPGETRIYKSRDNGATWTSSVFDGYGGQDAPSQVDIAYGRIWKSAYSGRGPGFFSAPIDADLMKESSWTLSVAKYGTFALPNGQKMKPGNELSLIKAKTGVLFSLGRDSIYRPEDGWKPGITTIQPDLNDLTKTTWDPTYAGPRLPGNENGKCTARYD
ncbi:MAG: glycoside hydrolase, partial [Planctomycetes bacterium]|nr:glycoside hydrolase [Planctomycetota bacterium]